MFPRDQHGGEAVAVMPRQRYVYSQEVLRRLMVDATSEGEPSREAFQEIRDAMWAGSSTFIEDPAEHVADAMEDLGRACYAVACETVGVEPKLFAVYARVFGDFDVRLVVMHGDRVLWNELTDKLYDKTVAAFRAQAERITERLVAELHKAWSAA